ncbi:MAG: AraC family transcriptional regulator [Verrucomicrobiota bacterium]
MELRVHARSVKTRRSGPEPYRATRLTFLRLAKGRTRWTIDGAPFELHEGDVLVVKPGQIFSGIESSEQVAIRVEQVEFEWDSEESKPEAGLVIGIPFQPDQAALLASQLREVASPIVSNSAGMDLLFAELLQSSDKDEPLVELQFQSCAAHLLTSICVALGKQQTARRNPTASETEQRVIRFLSALEARCEQDWTLSDLADEVGLKRSRFGVICRQITGESPSTYLNRLRIRRSRRLLRSTALSITDIAFECGFNSSQYFAKLFRQFQGHEPTHYREIAKGMKEGDGIRYLKGDSARIVAFADERVGEGDFSIEGTIALDRLGGTAASLEFGGDRFGFDGREGRFFLEGETLGRVQFFQRNAGIIREEVPFSFALQRTGEQLQIRLNEQVIAKLPDNPKRSIGRIGLRPLRNGIHLSRFLINGTHASLRESTSR